MKIGKPFHRTKQESYPSIHNKIDEKLIAISLCSVAIERRPLLQMSRTYRNAARTNIFETHEMAPLRYLLSNVRTQNYEFILVILQCVA